MIKCTLGDLYEFFDSENPIYDHDVKVLTRDGFKKIENIA